MPTNLIEIRDRSKRIFGNRYMLEVCAAMNNVTDRTNLSGLIGDSGLSPSVYFSPLHRLEEVGLLRAALQADDDRRERWYRPNSSSLWMAAQELVSE